MWLTAFCRGNRRPDKVSYSISELDNPVLVMVPKLICNQWSLVNTVALFGKHTFGQLIFKLTDLLSGFEQLYHFHKFLLTIKSKL